MLKLKDLGINRRLSRKLDIAQAPLCECGCGGKCHLIAEDTEGLHDAVCGIIAEGFECVASIGVVVRKDDVLLYQPKDEEFRFEIVSAKKTMLPHIGEMIKSMDFHHIIALEETGKGEYSFIEE